MSAAIQPRTGRTVSRVAAASVAFLVVFLHSAPKNVALHVASALFMLIACSFLVGLIRLKRRYHKAIAADLKTGATGVGSERRKLVDAQTVKVASRSDEYRNVNAIFFVLVGTAILYVLPFTIMIGCASGLLVLLSIGALIEMLRADAAKRQSFAALDAVHPGAMAALYARNPQLVAAQRKARRALWTLAGFAVMTVGLIVGGAFMVAT